MTGLREVLAGYLELRRRLGYSLEGTGQDDCVLSVFDRSLGSDHRSHFRSQNRAHGRSVDMSLVYDTLTMKQDRSYLWMD